MYALILQVRMRGCSWEAAVAHGPRTPTFHTTLSRLSSLCSCVAKTPTSHAENQNLNYKYRKCFSKFVLTSDCQYWQHRCKWMSLKCTTKWCTGRTRIQLHLCFCTGRNSGTTGPSHTQGHECLGISMAELLIFLFYRPAGRNPDTFSEKGTAWLVLLP